MKYMPPLFYFVLLTWLKGPSLFVVCESQGKILTDLRRFKDKGVAGRFAVSREALERELLNRKHQDNICGHDVKLQLPYSLPHASYNNSGQGEVMFLYAKFIDLTLADELSIDLKEQVSTTYHVLVPAIPVVTGRNKKHGILCLHLFTNSTKKVLHPQFTSVRGVTHVDSFEEADDGTVTVRFGDDVMVFQAQDFTEAKTKGKEDVGKDFDQILGEVIMTTNYPLPLDWDCEFLGFGISFCQVLEEVRCELIAVGGDACGLTLTKQSSRSSVSMKIFNVTGIFGEVFPYLATTIPTESFEGEFFDREHVAGLRYPCLTP